MKEKTEVAYLAFMDLEKRMTERKERQCGKCWRSMEKEEMIWLAKEYQ